MKDCGYVLIAVIKEVEARLLITMLHELKEVYNVSYVTAVISNLVVP